MKTKRHGPIVAGIASIPSRAHALKIALTSIWGQVDCVEVVLNGYDVIPQWLYADRISVTTSRDIGDHADNAKFFGMQRYQDGVYFAIDDDIQYPPDYVSRMLECMDRFPENVAVGVHGAFVPATQVSFMHRRVFRFWEALTFDTPTSYVGTGTIALPRVAIPSSPLQLFTDTGMSDLFVAAHLKEQGVPVVCIKRPANWLKKIKTPGYPSLWERAQTDSSRQDKLLIQAAPWGTGDLLKRCGDHILGSIATEVRVALEVADDLASQLEISEDALVRLRERWKEVRSIIRCYAGPAADRLSDLGLR